MKRKLLQHIGIVLAGLILVCSVICFPVRGIMVKADVQTEQQKNDSENPTNIEGENQTDNPVNTEGGNKSEGNPSNQNGGGDGNQSVVEQMVKEMQELGMSEEEINAYVEALGMEIPDYIGKGGTSPGLIENEKTKNSENDIKDETHTPSSNENTNQIGKPVDTSDGVMSQPVSSNQTVANEQKNNQSNDSQPDANTTTSPTNVANEPSTQRNDEKPPVSQPSNSTQNVAREPISVPSNDEKPSSNTNDENINKISGQLTDTSSNSNNSETKTLTSTTSSDNSWTWDGGTESTGKNNPSSNSSKSNTTNTSAWGDDAWEDDVLGDDAWEDDVLGDGSWENDTSDVSNGYVLNSEQRLQESGNLAASSSRKSEDDSEDYDGNFKTGVSDHLAWLRIALLLFPAVIVMCGIGVYKLQLDARKELQDLNGVK